MLPDDWIKLDTEMNDQKSPLPDPTGQGRPAIAPASLGRRRFARGAAPVILGSLISKPVLGAEYICTVSGNASGNASAHLTNDIACDVGMSPDEWKSSTTWPSPFTRGALPDATNNCQFPAPGKGTLFNGYTTSGGKKLADQFWTRNAGNAVQACGVRVTSNNRPSSTMLEVLNAALDPTDLDGLTLRLGKATVASLLNAASPSIAYPTTANRIVEMFNAVRAGGTYRVDGANVSLTKLGVIEYFESLYS